MTPEEKFNERLKEFIYILCEEGVSFALFPKKTIDGWVWLRKVKYIRYFNEKERKFSIRYYL